MKTATALRNHSAHCATGQTNLIYSDGVYEPKKSVFDKLEDVGISVDQSKQHYLYFAVFDCEAYLSTENLQKKSKQGFS
ncbi:hypothetical protein EB796_015450 [Bugula neritina]|uniref:Uncharacterized protein n=1 Tax=Bugula neritina TaxID=10212 RepID=A0A7J7JKY5_BUGNE|nr:hypothetical protein EB796_015450 [Bugula neritina]